MADRSFQDDDGAGEGRRRHVTVLFTDLCGYTALNEAIDPEETDNLKREVEGLAGSVIRRHGGAVSQIYGDGILAVFDYPIPQEDAGRRAVEAALELHEATRSAHFAARVPDDFQVRMHTAIHAGVVFVREGDALHGRYELTGDAVNTTSRLCNLAARDEILVSDSVLEGIDAFFATTSKVGMELKGKKSLVQAHQVLGRTGVKTRFEAATRRGLTAFIGRETELERLLGLLDQGAEPHAKIALVSGGPGIGKTRLLEELGRRAAGRAQLLRGVCESYGEMAALEPFVQVLRQLFGISTATPVEEGARAVATGLAALSGELLKEANTFLQLLSLCPWPEDKRATVVRMSAARSLAQLLLTVSERGPLLLVLDDWQWADDASRTVLDYLRHYAGERPLLVVVGLRGGEPVDPSLDGIELLQLRPFGQQESAEIIRTLRPRVLDLGAARAIHQRSGGNPLFLEELCRSLPEDALAGEKALEESGIPTTLHGLIQARVNRLPKELAQVLRVAAVIGNELPLALLTRVLPDDDIPSLVEQLVSGDLLHSTGVEGTLRFKHGLTREVIYESVRIAERREIHRATALAIEQTATAATRAEQCEALAYHYRGCGEHDRAAVYSELAGDKAMLSSALDRARLHYSNALAALDKLATSTEGKQRWLATCAKWAGVYVYSPSRQQIETLSRAAQYASEIGNRLAQAHIAHWCSWIHYVLGEYGQAITEGRKGLALAENEGDERLVAQLRSSVGQCYAAAGDHAVAIELLDLGLEAKASRARVSKPHVLAQGYAYALGCRAAVHADRGDHALARRDLADARAAISGSGHAIEGSLAALEAMVHLYAAEFDACERSGNRAREIAERVNSAYVFGMGTIFRGYAQFAQGQPSGLTEMRQALQWLEARDTGLFSGLNYGCLAEAFATASRASEARSFAASALARKEAGDALGETMAYRALARLSAALEPDAPDTADELLGRALASAAARGSARDAALTHLLAAELWSKHPARLAQAKAVLAQAIDELERMQLDHYVIIARRLQAAL